MGAGDTGSGGAGVEYRVAGVVAEETEGKGELIEFIELIGFVELGEPLDSGFRRNGLWRLPRRCVLRVDGRPIKRKGKPSDSLPFG